MVIEESGDIQAALENLDKIEKYVLDKITLKEKKGNLSLKILYYFY